MMTCAKTYINVDLFKTIYIKKNKGIYVNTRGYVFIMPLRVFVKETLIL